MTRDIGLLILRLAGLYLAAGHGWGKVLACVAVALLGPGRFSIDARLGGR